MEYLDIVRDFAKRTLANLDLVASAQRAEPASQAYETTQLINSLLGLIVFPQQRYVDSIPQLPLEELQRRGWPIPRVVGRYPQASDLRDLVRHLRNSIAHFNIQFQSDHAGQINGLTLWDIHPGSGRTTWKAELTVDEIDLLARSFVTLLLEPEMSPPP